MDNTPLLGFWLLFMICLLNFFWLLYHIYLIFLWKNIFNSKLGFLPKSSLSKTFIKHLGLLVSVSPIPFVYTIKLLGLYILECKTLHFSIPPCLDISIINSHECIYMLYMSYTCHIPVILVIYLSYLSYTCDILVYFLSY